MKIANQPPPPQSPSTTSQENPITPTSIQNFLLPLTSADFMMDKLESWVTITSVKLNFADDIGSNEMLLTADDRLDSELLRKNSPKKLFGRQNINF